MYQSVLADAGRNYALYQSVQYEQLQSPLLQEGFCTCICKYSLDIWVGNPSYSLDIWVGNPSYSLDIWVGNPSYSLDIWVGNPSYSLEIWVGNPSYSLEIWVGNHRHMHKFVPIL